MIDAIKLGRHASENFAYLQNARAAMAPEAAIPALVRRPSSGIKIQIQIPLLAIKIEEAPVAIMIITDAEDPIIPTCNKRQKCGHVCYGVENEKNCPPCLDLECADKHYKGGVNADELCGICYTSELGAEAVSKLSCGHVFHTICLMKLLQHRWSDLRITWAFMSCPSCKHGIEMKEIPREIASELGPLISFKTKCDKIALVNAERQGILKDARVAEKDGDFYGQPQAFANKRCSLYQCHSCKEPYFGGLIDCEQEMANAEQNKTRKEDLLC